MKIKLFLLAIAMSLSFFSLNGQAIKSLKTPKKQFKNISDYPFKEHYLELQNGLRMHYVEEGAKKSPVILLLHGEPNWSYVYRNIIPKLVAKGYRVIAPDLIGFGKSDKPVDKEVHTYSNHTYWMRQFINKLELKGINCYAHDWGAMIGLRLVAHQPELFSKVAISYGFLFTGEEEIPESFYGWQNFSQTDSAFQAGTIVNWATHNEMSKSTQEAYNAPFPSEKYKAGVRKLPVMLPLKKEDPEAIINKELREKLKLFNKPFLTIWGDSKDEMWMSKDKIMQEEIPGAKGIEHKTLKAHHFIQEDAWKELSQILLNFFQRIDPASILN